MKSIILLVIVLNFINVLTATNNCQQDFLQQMLTFHNNYRSRHNAQNLIVDTDITKTAQQYAELLARNNLFQHSNVPGLGENLALLESNNLGSCQEIAKTFIDGWYNEISKYNFNNPGFSQETGHFTQVVWKATSRLGCGIAINGNKAYGVCNYSPPGNVQNAFSQNVEKSNTSQNNLALSQIPFKSLIILSLFAYLTVFFSVF